MTPLRKRMIQDMELRNYSETTIKAYVHQVAKYAYHYDKCPSKLGEKEVREYLLHLQNGEKVSARTRYQAVGALRFFYRYTLGRVWMLEYLPYPKIGKTLPDILSQKEVAKLLESTKTLREYIILAVLYDTSLRVSELVNLELRDIDSRRMLIHVRNGKGRKDRYVKLSEPLLEALRVYWQRYRPRIWLFPSQKRLKRPIATTTVQRLCQEVAKRAGVKKRVHPHALRHAGATHIYEEDADLQRLQVHLGHSSILQTVRYTHLSKEYIAQGTSPLDALPRSKS